MRPHLPTVPLPLLKQYSRARPHPDDRPHGILRAGVYQIDLILRNVKNEAVGRIGGGRYKYGVHVVSEFIGHKPGHFGGCSKYFNQHYLAERHFLVADELPDRFPKGIVKRQAAEIIPLQDAEKLTAQIGPDDQADQEEQHDHYGQRDQIDNPGVDGVGKGKQFADGRDKSADAAGLRKPYRQTC